MIELLNRRQENTKTFDSGGGKRQLEAFIGAIHYKDNYADALEQWKDIDLTWEGNKITKAPYELTLDGQKITIKDKKSGEVSTIELLDVEPAGLKFEIIPENTRVSFRHTLPTDKIPFEAKFNITGKGLINTKAFDDDGELVLDVAVVGDTLTEKLNEVRDKQTGNVRVVKGQIKIDPTWQVGASADDCWISPLEGNLYLTTAYLKVGRADNFETNEGLAARFLNVTIPASSTITLANLKCVAWQTNANTVVNTRLRAQTNVNPNTFSTKADFDARTWTTAYVNWDAIPAWTTDVEYTSPDFTAVIQEVANLGAITHLVVLWDDFQQRSTQASQVVRYAYSYDGSTTKAPKLVVTYTTSIPAVAGSTVRKLLSLGML